MERSCENCKNRVCKNSPLSVCERCEHTCVSYWKPSLSYLCKTHKDVTKCMADLADKCGLKVYNEYKPGFETTEVIFTTNDEYRRIVEVFAFKLDEVELTRENLTIMEEHLKDKLDHMDVYNMDVASLYPTKMICQHFESHKPIKPLSHRVSCKSYADGFRSNVTIIDEIHDYCKRDVEATKDLYEAHVRGKFTMTTKPTIKNVIFNDPATIVFWSDDTKTVVKCQEGDVFDPEKGLAMAICKKMMGNNKRDYYNIFLKWMKKEKKKEKREPIADVISVKVDSSGFLALAEEACCSIQDIMNAIPKGSNECQ